jgi:hypothetical protein
MQRYSLRVAVHPSDPQRGIGVLTRLRPPASGMLTRPLDLTPSNLEAAIHDGATSGGVAILSARLDISLG